MFELKVGAATVKQTKVAQVMGVYESTNIDKNKACVEFRITSMGRKNTIVWLSGKVDLVTDAKLAKLQSSHTWAPDF